VFMTWKKEKWLSDVFPGRENIYAAYKDLQGRDLAIVCAAVLDLALAELITLRLNNYPDEVEDFLGLDGDGRAPAATFGSRIQLALLLNIITEEDAKILRALKDLRNEFAHTVKVTFVSPNVAKYLRKLFSLLRQRYDRLKEKGLTTGGSKFFDNVGPALGKQPAAGEGLVLALLAVYQAYFHKIHGGVIPAGKGYSGPKLVAI
jgi:hypothetical protein